MKNFLILILSFILIISCDLDKDSIHKSRTNQDNHSNTESSKYHLDGEGIHYVLMITDDVSEEKDAIKLFNSIKEENKSKGLSTITLKTADQGIIDCLIIRGFHDLGEANSYILDLQTELVFPNKRTIFGINQANFRTLVKSNDLKGYKLFYNKLN